MNNLYAQYGAVDFEQIYSGDQPIGFHALFSIFGVEASLDSNDWWDCDQDMAEVGALVYADSGHGDG